MATDISGVNQKIVGSVTGFFKGGAAVKVFGWFLFAIVVISVVGWWYWNYLEKKKFNRIIKIHSIVNGIFVETMVDTAKAVKLGKGGFEIIYLKKNKTWKLAHGARSGVNTYNMYVMQDGYWYPAQAYANIYEINKLGGYIPIVTTNPTMRSQYTSLEKQIDALHGDQRSFWEKYGNWILSLAFILIIGVLAWMIYREMAPLFGQFTSLTEKMGALTDKMNELVVNLHNGNNGLVPK